MTKTKLTAVIAAFLLLLTMATSAKAATTEQVYAKSNAPIAAEEATRPTVVIATKAEKPHKVCKNWLANDLKDAGFKKDRLRIAWAIVMRESKGHERSISSTQDYGLFQFNRAAWSGHSWWNSRKLLTKDYNIEVAWEVSQKGHTWYPWDIDGQGRHLGRYTSPGTYAVFKSWYSKYPSNCK